MSELRLFQDAEGMIPANEVGNPVGKLIRKSGNYDLLQGTTLSKPVVGRWPKGAKARNLVKGSGDYSTGSWLWPSGTINLTNGLTATYVGEFNEAGKRFVRYSINGTNNATSGLRTLFTVSAKDFGIPATLGEKFICSYSARVYSGIEQIPTATDGPRIDVFEMDALGQNQRNIVVGPVRTTDWTARSGPLTVENATSKQIKVAIGIRLQNGVILDNLTVDFADVQLERVATDVTIPTAYQPTDNDGVPLAGYGQVRNLAVKGSDFGDVLAWVPSNVSNGITFTKLSHGSDIHGNFIEYRAEGTTTNSWSGLLYRLASVSPRPVANTGDVFTGSAKICLTRGSMPSSSGVAVEVSGVTSSGSYVEGAHSTPYSGDTPVRQIYSRTILNNSGNVTAATIGVSLRGFTSGAVIDIDFRIYDVQLERGATATPLQFNYGPNNITEPGVEDVMFLYNDGNDSLNYTLPTETYYVASVNVAGNIKYETITGGLTNFLRSERTVDVIVRSTPFTDKDKEVIDKVWSKYTL